MKHIF